MRLEGVKKKLFGKIIFEGITYEKTTAPCKDGILLAVSNDESFKAGSYYKITTNVVGVNNFIFYGEEEYPVPLLPAFIGNKFVFYKPVSK